MNIGRMNIEKRTWGDVAILDCSGCLVYRHEAELLFEAVEMSVASSRCVVLNLSGVSLVDSGGLGMLVMLHQFAASAKCELKIYGATRKVSHLLSLTNLHSLLNVYSTEDQAIESHLRNVA